MISFSSLLRVALVGLVLFEQVHEPALAQSFTPRGTVRRSNPFAQQALLLRLVSQRRAIWPSGGPHSSFVQQAGRWAAWADAEADLWDFRLERALASARSSIPFLGALLAGGLPLVLMTWSNEFHSKADVVFSWREDQPVRLTNYFVIEEPEGLPIFRNAREAHEFRRFHDRLKNALSLVRERDSIRVDPALEMPLTFGSALETQYPVHFSMQYRRPQVEVNRFLEAVGLVSDTIKNRIGRRQALDEFYAALCEFSLRDLGRVIAANGGLVLRKNVHQEFFMHKRQTVLGLLSKDEEELLSNIEMDLRADVFRASRALQDRQPSAMTRLMSNGWAVRTPGDLSLEELFGFVRDCVIIEGVEGPQAADALWNSVMGQWLARHPGLKTFPTALRHYLRAYRKIWQYDEGWYGRRRTALEKIIEAATQRRPSTHRSASYREPRDEKPMRGPKTRPTLTEDDVLTALHGLADQRDVPITYRSLADALNRPLGTVQWALNTYMNAKQEFRLLAREEVDARLFRTFATLRDKRLKGLPIRREEFFAQSETDRKVVKRFFARWEKRLRMEIAVLPDATTLDAEEIENYFALPQGFLEFLHTQTQVVKTDDVSQPITAAGSGAAWFLMNFLTAIWESIASGKGVDFWSLHVDPLRIVSLFLLARTFALLAAEMILWGEIQTGSAEAPGLISIRTKRLRFHVQGLPGLSRARFLLGQLFAWPVLFDALRHEAFHKVFGKNELLAYAGDVGALLWIAHSSDPFGNFLKVGSFMILFHLATEFWHFWKVRSNSARSSPFRFSPLKFRMAA